MTVAASQRDGGGGGRLEIRLLGSVRAFYDDRKLELGGAQARGVLAVLMLHPGQVLPRGVIVDHAWGADAPVTALALVTAYISRLRGTLVPASAHVRFEAVQPGYCARIDPGLIDAHRFAALVRLAEQDRAANEDHLAITHLEQALALWKGGGLALEDVESPWLRAQAGVLQEQRLDALEQAAALYCDNDQPGRAIRLLRAEAPRHPQRDVLVSLLVRALATTGQGALAVEVADDARDALDQAGLPLGPRLREARRRAQRPVSVSVATAAPQQLPADTGALTGRGQELAELLTWAESVREASAGATVISAIDGMAGIGRTALSVHAGHRLAAQFPDGQLFVDLHGFAQGLQPRTAMEVLGDVLRTLGVSPQQIPHDQAARAALYRDRLAGKRILLVLDNASSEHQVRPLLPGHPGCLVMVTSRRRLKALDEARVLSLDVLSVRDAIKLLCTISGPGRILADDPYLEEIARLCGYLPLALRIAAALLRHRPSWTLARLACKLRDARPALAGFSDGDRDLAAVFDLSYTALPDDQQRLFRCLALHPGPDIDSYAAATLLDTDPDTAESLLQHLVDHNLLTESSPGRYRMHDLIRAHAHVLADSDPASERDAALRRLLDYYLHTGHAAAMLLLPTRQALVLEPPRPGAVVLTPTDDQAARAWFEVEHAALTGVIVQAAAAGLDQYVTQLPWIMTDYLAWRGHWHELERAHHDALEAARRLGDVSAQARAHGGAARAASRLGETDRAHFHLRRAMELYEGLADRNGLARIHRALGNVREVEGNLNEALEHGERALELFRALSDRAGEASALGQVGWYSALLGDHRQALAYCTQALAAYEGLGDKNATAGIWDTIGYAHHHLGNHPEAIAWYEKSIDVFRELGDRYYESDVLTHLGDTYQAVNEPDAARYA